MNDRDAKFIKIIIIYIVKSNIKFNFKINYCLSEKFPFKIYITLSILMPWFSGSVDVQIIFIADSLRRITIEF